MQEGLWGCASMAAKVKKMCGNIHQTSTYVIRSSLHAQEGRWGWAIVAAEAVAGAAASAGASIGEAVGELASLIRREDGDSDGKPKRSANVTGLLSRTASSCSLVKMRCACMCSAAQRQAWWCVGWPCSVRHGSMCVDSHCQPSCQLSIFISALVSRGTPTPSCADAGTRRAEGSGDEDAMDELVMPPDLPIEAIAEEVKESWRLKEVHVERLLQQAVARSERPWLILLTTLSALSAALLAFVLLKLTSVLH